MGTMSGRLTATNSIRVKIESLLTEYLQKHGHLALAGIGVIRHEGSGVVELDEDSGGYRFAPGSLSFEHSPKTEMDGELVAHIARETGKMKSLVGSDIESFLHFGQELINISKPFHIMGLGVLQKTAQQTVEFIQEDEPKAGIERGRKNGHESRHQRNKSTHLDDSGRRGGASIPKAAVWTLGLFILLGAGYALYRLSGKPSVTETAGGSGTKREATAASSTDSTPAEKPTANAGEANTSAAGGFRVVIEYAYRERALKRYADLKEWGHDIRMTTLDSQQFKMFIPIDAPLSDTAKHRDSLRLFFGRPVRIEINGNE